MPVLLPTDILFFLMLSGLLLMVIHALRQDHLRRPWRKVARSRNAMISAVILLEPVILAQQ